MIRPVLQDDTFLENVERGRVQREHFHLWWLGQSSFLLQWEGRHLLFDPYLSDSLTKKYASTDKPHVRMTERVVAPEKLGFVDIVTSSHNHTDHLDADTLIPLLRVNPKLEIVIPEANREFVTNRLSTAAEIPLGLDAGQHVTVHGFKITALPAAHETIEQDPSGRCKFLGYVVEFGPWAVYHSGDTVRYPGMAETLLRWNIDVAMLPINGAKPERRVAGNLDGRQAAQLGADIHARCVIPCHYEMFEFNTADPAEFILHARRLGVNYRVVLAGERWSSRELPGKSAS